MINTSAMAIIHSIYQLLEVLSGLILLQFSLRSLNDKIEHSLETVPVNNLIRNAII
jgi:uncharacterized membrane protein